MEAAQPTVFGRYQLLELIAKGGMAEVFKARLSGAAGTEKLLCIKRILPHLSESTDFSQLFVTEARIALPLTHGNITQVFDFGEVGGTYFLAMEYIRGQNLLALLRRVAEGGGVLEVPASIYIASEVCKGLQYAHSYIDQHGKRHVIVHRDVSPHNVLISYNGEVKLTDFGIASAASAMDREPGVIRGKPSYVSPEQADGKTVDPRSDIFSLGAVLYEMLAGVRPFDAEGEAATLERVRQGEVLPPSEVNPALRDHPDARSIDQIVLTALARDPAQRYQRAQDMQVALTQILHRHWPDYTADRLASTIKEHFDWEIAASEGRTNPSGGDAARDRLLYQLSRAGVAVDPEKATSELLELGTVALSAQSTGGTKGHPIEKPPEWRRFVLGFSVGVLLLAGGVAALVLRAQGGKPATSDARVAEPPLAPTDHLAPTHSASAGTGASSDEGDNEDEGESEGSGTGSAGNAPGTARPVRPTSARAVAFINCNSWPWSVVYLDGRKLRGNTPLYRVKVGAGKHRLRFVNPELGLSKEVNVTVEAGETRTVAVSLHQ